MQNTLNFEDPKDKILDRLNEEQCQAVTHKDGPLLIIAGAGTGKTTVITKRIAYLIAAKIAQPSEILALTFTDKAASEMEERVDQLVPYGYTDMWISTFHAFGDRLLRDYSIDLGLPANFKVLTATEQAIFMRQNIFAFSLKHYLPVSNPLSHIKALLNHFSRLKDELISPKDYLSFAQQQLKKSTHDTKIESEKTLELAEAYERYCDLMIQAGNLDFGDLIYLTHKLLSENKKVLDSCQERFKYILIDEYQDTNFAQNAIVKLLASKYGNITVVGDDDQSIYRFRGASISNILQFKDDYDHITQIVLNKNYRSSQEILDASYKLIQHNNPDRLEIKNNINKKLLGFNHNEIPVLLHCDTLSCEADKVAEQITELRKQNGYRFNDFAILVRANAHADPFIQSLNIAGIPYSFSGASGLFAQTEIKMLIALIKTLVYSDDNLAFYQLATSELYNIANDKLTDIYTLAKRQNRSSFEMAKWSIGENAAFAEDTKLAEMITDIETYRSKLKELNAGELLYAYLTEKGYLKILSTNPDTAKELKILNIAKFFDRIAQFNHSSDDKSMLAFLENLELILEVGDEVISSDIDPDIDAVNILTVHASKGLEWPVVFVVNMVADRFPGRNKREQLPIPDDMIKERLPEGDFHLQEERRLFYVAATRAKALLFLTSSDDYGGKTRKKLSQFVLEILDEASAEKLKHKLSPQEKIERFKKIEKELPAQTRKPIEGTIKLSRLQIDDYHTCPKKYYYVHIVKLSLIDNNSALMFGSAIHGALDHYFSRKIRGEEATLRQLLDDFAQSFKNVGFITREHEERRYKSGIETLTKFYQYDTEQGQIPTSVETAFEFIENNVRINGRYDLMFGEGDKAEIWDFKTGDVSDQKKADERIRKSTQMRIYALSWLEKYGFIPKTTLYFIESGLKGERTFKEKELDETKEMIFEAADGIKSNNFDPKPDKFACGFCPYKDICKEAIN